MIRKIPTCRHVFHTKCIDSWFQSKMSEPNQRCPMCNTEITVAKLKEALKAKPEESKKQPKDDPNAKLKEQQRDT